MTKNTTPIQVIYDEKLTKAGVELSMLRLDMVHPDISGNKWYKLKYNLIEAADQGKRTILTFGGAFSNHIAAVAAAGEQFNFKTIGIIRGEELSGEENHTLKFAKEHGMQLEFISREEYRRKNDPEFIEKLKDRFGDFYLVPEGGSNLSGVKGCAEILKAVDKDYDYICCACGTGATLAGLAVSAEPKQGVIGFPALKGGGFLKKEIDHFIDEYFKKEKKEASSSNYSLCCDYHFGGFAKYTDELIDFIRNFKQDQGIELDFIYTGKMMYGIYDLVSKSYFPKGSKILAIHTGGLQGNRSLEALQN